MCIIGVRVECLAAAAASDARRSGVRCRMHTGRRLVVIEPAADVTGTPLAARPDA
jgi:hypothetical protein